MTATMPQTTMDSKICINASYSMHSYDNIRNIRRISGNASELKEFSAGPRGLASHGRPRGTNVEMNHQGHISFTCRKPPFPRLIGLLLLILVVAAPMSCRAGYPIPCLGNIPPRAGLLVAGPDGNILVQRHGAKAFVPASTLKILTSLAALHYLGPAYRFRTDFYLSPEKDLVVKGYGDPMLISQTWETIADHIARKIRTFKDLILDDTFFHPHIRVPGQDLSTNRYDAPVGALSVNFNTVFFKRNARGKIVSAEPQTPMIPFARRKIRELREKGGRYTLYHDSRQAALYAGELLSCWLRRRGTVMQGEVRLGIQSPEDSLIYRYRSRFDLEQTIRKMFVFSNNFMANQIFLCTGASVYGPPATLEKGVKAVSAYADQALGLKVIRIVEGSGISRENHISPESMLTVLKYFKPYRHLLPREGPFLYKTGTLKCVRNRAGYIEGTTGGPGYFVLFLDSDAVDANGLMHCLGKVVLGSMPR